MDQPQRQPADQQHGNNREQKSGAHPQEPLGAHDSGKEVGARGQAQTGQVERQTDGTQHQVGTRGGIGIDVNAGTEGTDENACDDGATGQAQFDGNRNARQGNGDRAKDESQCHTQEDSDQIGFVKHLDGVAHLFLHILECLAVPNDDDAVTQQQPQVGCGQQLQAATVHSADVHAVVLAQAQGPQFAAINFGFGDEDGLGNEVAIDSVPVDITGVPVGTLLLAKEHLHRLGGIVVAHDDQQAVIPHEHGVRFGDGDLAVTPQARNHELAGTDACQISHCLADDALVAHPIGGNVGVVGFFLVIIDEMVTGAHQHLAHHGKGQNDAHDTQRIGNGTAQGRTALGVMQL